MIFAFRIIEERNRVVQEMFQRGVLILGAGRNAIRFAPPMVLTRDQADSVVSIFDDARAAVTGAGVRGVPADRARR